MEPGCVTKADLEATKLELVERMEATELRLVERMEANELRLVERMEANEVRLVERMEANEFRLVEQMEATRLESSERIEKTETTLLKEFRKWAVRFEAIVKVNEASIVGFNARLGSLEERVNDLESSHN